MVYNIDIMAKRFSKRVTRKTRIKLSPKDANEIIRQEFSDDRGNKFIFRMTGNPHSPSEPTIKGTVQYKDEE